MLQRVKTIQRLSQWVLNQIVQDVPEDSALCEFDCRKGQCTQGEWQECERRLNRAEGELMPVSAKLQEPVSDSQTETTTEASAVSS
jgi:hypothetical protein